ncbi:hypothetical protein OEZ86_012433 [Tetradesmus obliquus]|nr:hypothetical protein OEZ86_012433 [Tetradesmus obliquus]
MVRPSLLSLAAGLLLLLLLLLLLVPPGLAAPLKYVDDYWLRGRASWYGNQGSWVDPFVPHRGGGRSAFGVTEWGGCGLTNGDGTVLWPKEHVTAYASGNPDFPGACGRCYEVKCSPGAVLGWADKPVNFREAYFPFWWYANVTDEMGRSFPGNAGEEKAVLDVKCWGDQKSVVVKVIDICPCWYEPKGMAPYFQYGCCYKQQQHPKAGQLNLDLSFWAFEQLAHPEYSIMMSFEQLAHPEYGIMMVDYRPVDCDTKKPIQFDPGYISDKIYDNFPGVGWSWFAYNFQPMNKFAVVDAGKGLKGSAASCAELQYNGGLTWACRQCGSKEGFQPFAGADSVTFWMRDSGSPGKVPPVRLQLGNPDIKKSCNAKLDLATRTPQSRTADGWLQFTIPMRDFDCPEPAIMNQLLWEAKPGTSSGFGMCLDEVSINRPGAAAPAAGPPASG